MQGYPKDHPLWQDINFTSEEVYQQVQSTILSVAGAQESGHISQVNVSNLPGFDDYKNNHNNAWKRSEDLLILFCKSEYCKDLNYSYIDLSSILKRSSDAIKNRFQRKMRQQLPKFSQSEMQMMLEEGRQIYFKSGLWKQHSSQPDQQQQLLQSQSQITNIVSTPALKQINQQPAMFTTPSGVQVGSDGMYRAGITPGSVPATEET
eukprot:TRINITY_DN5987_c0_g1_i1.p2 TRINITY_DN5987_c0_g1~~TRINITY_DN5987_c0_g1_i1.p2  ORF type:complete len:206 (-),score=22.05 TRINITY_DN5987_c0_g1_i1:153-770(-)